MTTFAFNLDYDDQKKFDNQATELTIELIESFYNYRTVGERFDLMTSVLSNQSQLIKVELRGKDHKEILVRKEYTASKKVTMINNASNAPHLYLKHVRINAALQRIKEGLQVDTNNQANQIDKPLFDYFYTLMDESDVPIVNTNGDEENDGNIAVDQRANYCRYERKASKQPCSNCTAKPLYTIEMLLDTRKTIGQSEILKELKAHHHPKCREIKLGNNKKRQRSTAEAVEELIDHYVHFHQKVRPKT